MTQEDQIYFGGQVKALGDNRVGGYLVRFSSAADPDLVKDFFTKDTEFGTNTTPPTLYHHGLDPVLKSRIVGTSEWKIDSDGVWIEAQLSLRDAYERHIMKLVREGKLGWSSGAVGHAVEREKVGESNWLKTWLIGEASLTPAPADPKNSAMPIKSLPPAPLLVPDEDDEAEKAAAAVAESTEPTPQETKTIDTTMSEEIKAENLDFSAIAEAAATRAATAAAEATMKAFEARQAAQAAKAEEEIKLAEAKTVKAEFSAPAIHMDSTTKHYDNYGIAELATTAEFLNNAAGLSHKNRAASENLYKAIGRRLESSEGSTETFRPAQNELKSFLHKAGIKANEIHQSTLSGFGDEWVGVAYSSELWNLVRQEAVVASMFTPFEFPAGNESLVVPLESTDPTWYLVDQSASLSSNPGGIPTNTVTSSKTATAKKTMTLSKIGARQLWTGEISEDAVLPFAQQLMNQLAVSGAEYFESALLDGDTETGATTNINDIAGTPASTDYFLAFDGPRKLALVTNTANSRDAGVLTAEDFLETAKLMGTNGRNAIDKSKVKFIIDNSTHYKSLTLPEVKTRDVNSAATVENGNLTRIYGYDIHVSGHMCKAGSGLSNTAGKIDVDTASNNSKGQILAIRPDQWRLGYRRRMTMETTRVPAADATEIVVMMRAAFDSRDNEAAAISYNVTV